MAQSLAENVTNSFIFFATLISETKNIKLGTGTSNLSHSHPTLVAAHMASISAQSALPGGGKCLHPEAGKYPEVVHIACQQGVTVAYRGGGDQL